MEVQKSFFTTVTQSFELKQTEDVACNLCGGEHYEVIGVELIFEIRECTRCGLVYISPQPAAEELPGFYEGMYHDASDSAAQTRSLGYVEAHLRRVLRRRRPKGGELLEAGAGFGNFLFAIRDLPWTVTALEWSESALAFARARLPHARFIHGGIDGAPIAPASQDCIVLIAVLEHVKDPRATLRQLLAWLRPGGLLILQTPYVAPYIRAKRWVNALPVMFEAPRHLFDFSPKTLPRYLQELGCEDIQVEIARPYSSPTAFGAALIWVVKIVGLLLYWLSWGRYVYPFAGAIVVTASKPALSDESSSPPA